MIARRVGIAIPLAFVIALATASSAWSAGILQTTAGRPYTGPLFFTLQGNAVVDSSLGSVFCNESTLGAAASDAGSLVAPVAVTVSTFENTNNGSQACPDTITLVDHVDTTAADLPWAVSGDWVSDSTAGAPNGAFTISGVHLTALFTGGVTCENVGNFNATSTTTRELQAAVYNPANTASGLMEARFENAPMTTSGGSPECPDSSVTATYTVTGQDGALLEFRGTPPPVPNQTANVTTVSGIVRIKRPGDSGFTVLEGPTTIPIGSQIDTTDGRVELATASDSTGGTRAGEFFDGVFEIDQQKSSGKRRKAGGLTTVLELVPGVGCGKRQGGGPPATAKGNGLWGSEKGGGHSTKGNKGSGSTRGTVWFVGDRCNGTTVAKVKEGKIRFRDFEKKETIVLRKGDSYVAGK